MIFTFRGENQMLGSPSFYSSLLGPTSLHVAASSRSTSNLPSQSPRMVRYLVSMVSKRKERSAHACSGRLRPYRPCAGAAAPVDLEPVPVHREVHAPRQLSH